MGMDSMVSDQDLLKAMCNQDLSTFDILNHRYQGLVYASCKRQAPSEELDDCVQAVFLVLLRKPSQALRAPALASWLLVVSRHVCATARRSLRARERAEQEAAVRNSPSLQANNIDPVIEHLDFCMMQLPERQRAVISLHYLAGVNREEVAQELGIDIDTVHQHCRRGLERMRELLRRKGVNIPTLGLLAAFSKQAELAATHPNLILKTSAAGASASAYATGAIKAMTIASLVSTSVITASILAILGGAAVGIVNAEMTSPTISPVNQSSSQSDLLTDTFLAKTLKIDFTQSNWTDVLKYLGKVSNDMVIVDPQFSPSNLPKIWISATSMRGDNLLSWIERSTHTSHFIRDGKLYITHGPFVEKSETALTLPWKIILDQKMSLPITLTFSDTSLSDVLSFIQQMTGINFVIISGVDNSAPVTLAVSKMSVSTVLGTITRLTNCHYLVKDNAIGIYSDSAPITIPSNEPANSQKSIDAPEKNEKDGSHQF